MAAQKFFRNPDTGPVPPGVRSSATDGRPRADRPGARDGLRRAFSVRRLRPLVRAGFRGAVGAETRAGPRALRRALSREWRASRERRRRRQPASRRARASYVPASGDGRRALRTREPEPELLAGASRLDELLWLGRAHVSGGGLPQQGLAKQRRASHRALLRDRLLSPADGARRLRRGGPNRGEARRGGRDGAVLRPGHIENRPPPIPGAGRLA